MSAHRNASPREKISFVLPLAAGNDKNELLRAKILLASFLSFFSLEDLETFWIVSPPECFPRISAALRSLPLDARFKLISEYELIPELPRPVEGSPSRSTTGWHRQQAIKLAIAERMACGYYMTLDADVIAVKPFGRDSLIVGGRALCNIETANDYEELYVPKFARTETSRKQSRIDGAARILGVERPAQFHDTFPGETPVTLSVKGVLGLKAHLESMYQKPWRQTLLEKLPWTEYALYFLFMESSGSFDELHMPSHRNAVLRLDDSFWQPWYLSRTATMPHEWDAEKVFRHDDRGPFVVVQSYLGYPPQMIAGKVGGYLRVPLRLGESTPTAIRRYRARNLEWMCLRMANYSESVIRHA